MASTSDSPAPPSVIISHPDLMLPTESLTDWASFADHLVVAEVTKQRELAPTQEKIDAGEGYIPRVITVRIDTVLWSRREATAAPATFETDLDGWSFHGDERIPIRLAGEPMMNVGARVVMPIVYLGDEPGADPAKSWSPLGPGTIIPYPGSALNIGGTIPGNKTPGTIRARFTGDSVEALATALAATAPYPAVVGAMDLPPQERFHLLPVGYEN